MGRAVYAIIGIENQTDIHYAMPVRNMFYDVMSYEAQIKAAYRSYEKEKDAKFTHEEFLSKWKRTDKLVPVITLVVNFSSDKWEAPKSLHEMIDFKDEAMKRFVPDYSIPVIDFASMTDEEINKFQTTIREVAECARYVTSPEILMERIRKNDRYKGLDVTTAYVIENVLKTNINTEDYEAKEEVNMCKQMEEYLEGIKESGVEQGLQRGIQQGMQQGMQQGIQQGIQQGVQQGMHQGVQQGMTKVVEQMRKSGMSEEKINEILSIDVSAP